MNSFQNGVAKAEQEIMNKANSVGVKLKNISEYTPSQKQAYREGYFHGNKANPNKSGVPTPFYTMGFEDGVADWKDKLRNWVRAFDQRMNLWD